MEETKKISPALSLDKSAIVRGYEIRRLPLGRYLEVIEALKALPEKLAAACFPGMDAAQILRQLKKIDSAMLATIAVRAMTAAPQEAVRILSLCTGVAPERLLEDEAIGLDGAAEMAETAYEINQIGNFIQAAGRLAAMVKKNETRGNGSNG